MTDANISSQIGTINGAEIQAAEMATRRARSADVKRFAREMIQDHRAMQKMVDSIATAKNLTPEPMANADSLQSATKAEQDRLSQLTGAAFDSAYANSQVMAHQQALDFLNRASNATQDSDLRTVIQQAIPKVQAHLDRARTLVSGQSDTAATKQ